MLHARDQDHLLFLRAKLSFHDIEYVAIVEEDGPYAGQLMAIGLVPTRDRKRVRRILSSLPLVR